MKTNSLSRRNFLKVAGASTAIAVPVLAGYGIYLDAYGEYPPAGTPYQPENQTEENQTPLDGSCPILLILNKKSENPLGVYLSEILLAEGLNSFHSVDISDLRDETLDLYDLLILVEGRLDTSQSELLTRYVAQGGRLLSMRPDSHLDALFGVEKLSGTLSEGYIKTESNHVVSKGINPTTMQFHGDANLYRLAGADVIAWLYLDRDNASGYPGITVNQYGDGLASMWAFDLAKNIAYIRQGNPTQINQSLDGLDGVRTVDMFVDWIDLDRISIPQADEQQRLFVNLLTLLSQGKKPLPRIWYFPEDKKSILIATGDSHMNPAPVTEEVLGLFEKYESHMTVYYSPVILSDLNRAIHKTRFFISDHIPGLGNVLSHWFKSPTPQDIVGWRDRGHEFALHPYVDDSLENGWRLYWKEFTGRGYGPVSPTVRTHRVLWSGWVETARIQASYGIRMNMDYYHVGPSLRRRTGEWVYGHLTGSGRPMKFIDEQGRILNIYQQLTQLADEHLIAMDVPGWGGFPNLSPAEAVDVARYLFDRSVNHGDYCAITAQFHIDPFQVGGEAAAKASAFLEGTLSYVKELGLPIWTAQEWLHFSEARHESALRKFIWHPETKELHFEFSPHSSKQSDLTLMIPTIHDDRRISDIFMDKVKIRPEYQVVGGVEYACFRVDPRLHQFDVIYG